MMQYQVSNSIRFRTLDQSVVSDHVDTSVSFFHLLKKRHGTFHVTRNHANVKDAVENGLVRLHGALLEGREDGQGALDVALAAAPADQTHVITDVAHGCFAVLFNKMMPFTIEFDTIDLLVFEKYQFDPISDHWILTLISILINLKNV
jgi:hypothetical protein